MKSYYWRRYDHYDQIAPQSAPRDITFNLIDGYHLTNATLTFIKWW